MAASPSHRVSTGERLNTAETTGKLQQAVAARGIRMTRQRQVILQVMDDAEQHLDVDQILEREQKIDSGVHLVTVYRTIDLLKKRASSMSWICSTCAATGTITRRMGRGTTYTWHACGAARSANSKAIFTSN